MINAFIIFICIFTFLASLAYITEIIGNIDQMIWYRKKKGCWVIRRVDYDYHEDKYKGCSYVCRIEKNCISSGKLKGALFFDTAYDALKASNECSFRTNMVIIQI